jgi:membrane fusion protein (multidrug efflux system)
MRSIAIWTALAALSFGIPVHAQTASSNSPALRVAQMPSQPVKSWNEGQSIRAQLSPRRFTSLSAELGARVNRIAVREGESFKQGQTLIELDCSLQQAQLQKAQATLVGAEKTLSANQRLAALRSVGEIEIESAQAEVEKARADVALMKTTLSKCAIYAPFSGRVAEQKIREQQFVQPGQIIVDLIDDTALELEFIVPSKWLTWLRNGSALKVSIDETGKAYPAKVLRVGARVDPVSQSIKVVAVIDGRYPDLMAGMSGNILLSQPATH